MSKREVLLDDLTTDLATITVANSYNNDVGTIFRTQVPNWQLSRTDFPAIIVEAGIESISALTNLEYTSGTSLLGLDGWQITVTGIVKTNQDPAGVGTTASALEDFLEDILKCIDVDRQRSNPSYVITTKPDSIERIIDSKKCIGRGTINYSIKYDFQHDVP